VKSVKTKATLAIASLTPLALFLAKLGISGGFHAGH
jgi:hypothetical protein